MAGKHNPDVIKNVEAGVNKFADWLDSYGFESYDQFDVWGTRLGISAKKLFLTNKLLSAPLVLGLQATESFLPWSRRLFATKRRFAIGDAHFASGFLNLYKVYGKQEHLDTAETLLNSLLEYAAKSDSGIGWGYPYDWVTQYGVFPKETPLITVTPYCFNAFLSMYKTSRDSKYLDILDQISKFVAYDLREKTIAPNETASSYSPVDNSQVYNAIAYRAATLLKAYELFGKQEYYDKAIKNVRYVVNNQRDDGSWIYADDSRFIDNFHTCFVLNKLFESYRILNEDWILKSVVHGYTFYRENFFRKDNTPIHFYRTRFPKFRKIEMYDYAEGISLGVLLDDAIAGAFQFSIKLAADLINNFQLEQGSFVTRVSTLNTFNKVPYLRWPQAQLFYALTGVVATLKTKAAAVDQNDTVTVVDIEPTLIGRE